MSSGSPRSILFHSMVPSLTLPNRTKLKQFIIYQCKREGKEIEHINYIFCDDAYLLQVNQDFLKHDFYTDIITFQLSPAAAPLLADIYISIERVKDNALQLGVTFKAELHRVIFHGALHLCGYRDKKKAEQLQMRSLEEQWLADYAHVSRGTGR